MSGTTERGSVVLLRHGETDWSAVGKHTGRTDLPLNEAGIRAARALGPALAGRRFALALSSPLQRARRTAELAGIPDVELEPRLAEWDYGGYDGRTTAEISAELGQPWSLWSDGVVPGDTPGETLAQVAARAAAVLERIAPVVDGGGDVALAAHGHLLRVLGAVWCGLPPVAAARLSLSAGSLCLLGHEHDRPVIGAWNTRLLPETG